MLKDYKLIFIGEKIENQQWRIERQATLADAICLSKPLSHSAPDTCYQSIPLTPTKASICLNDQSIQVMVHPYSLEFHCGGPFDKEVYNLFNSFFIKNGKKVSYLQLFPHGKASIRRDKNRRVIAEAKQPYKSSRK